MASHVLKILRHALEVERKFVPPIDFLSRLAVNQGRLPLNKYSTWVKLASKIPTTITMISSSLKESGSAAGPELGKLKFVAVEISSTHNLQNSTALMKSDT